MLTLRMTTYSKFVKRLLIFLPGAPSPANQNKDDKAMSITRHEVGEDRPLGQNYCNLTGIFEIDETQHSDNIVA